MAKPAFIFNKASQRTHIERKCCHQPQKFSKSDHNWIRFETKKELDKYTSGNYSECKTCYKDI